MTEEKKIIPVRKDQLKSTSQSITRLTKEDIGKTYIKRSTENVARMRQNEHVKEMSNRRFIPIWFNDLPKSLREFRHKEVMWQGFHLALENIGLDPEEVKQRLTEGKTPWTDLEYTKECCQRAFDEHQMKMPKLTQTTKPKSKVTKPDDEQGVTGRARSSKQVEDSDDEGCWEERERRPKEDRFGKKPRVQIYKSSPTRSEKGTRPKRSRSREERKRSPDSTFICEEGCKVQIKNKKTGKVRECGQLCYRINVHGFKDCECKKHLDERHSEQTKRESRSDVPKERVSQRDDRYLTSKEKKILKKAHDLQERKREDCRRLTEKWLQQETEEARERKRATRERSESEEESSDEDSREDDKKPKISMIRVDQKKEVVLTPAPGWQEGRPEIRGESDTTEGVWTEDGIRDVEVRFVPRRRVEEPERRLPDGDLERHQEDPNRVVVIEDDDRIVAGRYAHEAEERESQDQEL